MSIYADITDIDAISILSPQDIEHYLLQKNWKQVRLVAGNMIFDKKTEDDETIRVWLPMENDIEEDFVLSLIKLIKTLSIYESRSQLEILEDFDLFSIGDVFRYQTSDVLARKSSSVPFSNGIKIIEQAKNILVSGATVAASRHKNAVFGSRKPTKAMEYANSLRLGQTERGSYIVKIISPISREEETKEQNTLPHIELPFERIALETAIRGAVALKETAQDIHKRGKFYIEPFNERIEDGLTAELCEAIVGKESNNKSPVNLSVSWSPMFDVQPSNNLPDRLEFPIHLFEYISEAAKIFRVKEPENVHIHGYVVKLHREKPSGSGDIVVLAEIQTGEYKGLSRKLKIKLNEEDYSLAHKAHHEWLEVKCSGILAKNELIDISKLSLIENQDNFDF